MRTNILNDLKTLFYPKVCFGCGYIGRYICKNCLVHKIEWVYQQDCHVCNRPSTKGYLHQECMEYTYLDGVIVVALYQGFLAELIKAVKYRFYHQLIPELGDLLAMKSLEHSNLFDDAVITFVPMSSHRARWRGFNQTGLLARVLAGLLDIQEPEAILRKVFSHRPQAKLGRAERLVNLVGAFELNGSKAFISSHNKFIIVDDVTTTGATLEQMAKVIKQGIPHAKVYGYVLAKD